MAQWGRWDDEVEEMMLVRLQRAYIRRRQWEARLWAVEMARALGEALGGGKGGSARRWRTGASGRQYEEVSADGLMRAMGAGWGNVKREA